MADPAILKALSLDAHQTKITPHGRSGFASTFKLTATVANGERPSVFFVKTGSSEAMFRGEHASLNAIYAAVPDFCPKSHAHGPLSRAGAGYFLATDFLDLSSAPSPSGSGLSLAAKLARLHTTPAPVPEGYDNPVFGFAVPTCCGETLQENSWRASWADFYADNRLRAILAAAVSNHGRDDALADAVEAVAARVVPRLIGDERLDPPIIPVVVHGDLWSGNHARGRIGGRQEVEELVFDPSAVYGHSEYELGIMRMFGGFDAGFWDEYTKLVPKAEPIAEWDDRLALYELYHHLNHFAIFGGGYRGGAMSIMKKLIAKHGS